MMMFDPAHPGEILKEECIEPLGLTVTQAAELLGVSRTTLSALINQRAGVSPLMALRLAAAFPNTSAQFWLNLQNQYDLSQERDNPVLSKIKPLVSSGTQHV